MDGGEISGAYCPLEAGLKPIVDDEGPVVDLYIEEDETKIPDAEQK